MMRRSQNPYTHFQPAWWLKSAHMQTIYPVLFPRRFKLSLQRERLYLPDNDFLDLDWIGNNPREIVIILHGLAGSIASPYAQGIMNAITQQGWQGVFMHFRGCSGEPNLLARSYHSGETEDLAFVVTTIRKRYPHAKLSVIGYSLGGNVLLKWLGESHLVGLIDAAIAVSVPFNLSTVVMRLHQGASRIYQWWLLNCLKKDMLKKGQLISSVINPNRLKAIKTFREFDELVTAPLHGFKDADHYYSSCSSKQFLKGIQMPTLIVHALDDPFMTPQCIPTFEELSQTTQLELYPYGGHVGFIAGIQPHKPIYWLEQRIPEFITTIAKNNSNDCR